MPGECSLPNCPLSFLGRSNVARCYPRKCFKSRFLGQSPMISGEFSWPKTPWVESKVLNWSRSTPATLIRTMPFPCLSIRWLHLAFAGPVLGPSAPFRDSKGTKPRWVAEKPNRPTPVQEIAPASAQWRGATPGTGAWRYCGRGGTGGKAPQRVPDVPILRSRLGQYSTCLMSLGVTGWLHIYPQPIVTFHLPSTRLGSSKYMAGHSHCAQVGLACSLLKQFEHPSIPINVALPKSFENHHRAKYRRPNSAQARARKPPRNGSSSNDGWSMTPFHHKRMRVLKSNSNSRLPEREARFTSLQYVGHIVRSSDSRCLHHLENKHSSKETIGFGKQRTLWEPFWGPDG